ncbi:carboxypeptidase-like regulatory domain-containing protein [Flavobacterium sp.]
MTSIQQDQLATEIVVENFIATTSPDFLIKLPGIEALNTSFGGNLEILRAFRNAQDENRTGYRVSKESVREIMSQQGFTAAAQVCAWAVATGDLVLQSKVTFVYSDLERMRDAEIADTCNYIHARATDHLATLEPFGLTAQTLAAFKDSIIIYNVLLPQCREGIVDRSSYTNQIKILFAQNREYLFRMDKLVTMLKFVEPTYYSSYYNARKIVNTGHTKQALRGNITDHLGLPIKKVFITIEAPKHVTVKSTAKGNYQFKRIPAGVWPVTFTRDGYETVKEFVVFTPTLTVKLNIILKPLQEQQRSA